MAITITSETTCACCLVCAPTTYDCRTRGGLAALVGFEAFTDPATPPTKRRTKTHSGLITAQVYTNSAGTARLTKARTGSETVQIDFPDFNNPPSGSTRNAACNLTLDHATRRITRNSVGTMQALILDVWHNPTSPITINLIFLDEAGAQVGTSAIFSDGSVSGVWPPATYRVRVSCQAEYLSSTFRSSPGEFLFVADLVIEDLAYAGATTVADDGTITNGGTATGNLYNTITNTLDSVAATGLSSVDDALTRLGAGNFATAVDAATTHQLPTSGSVVRITAGVNLWRRVVGGPLVDTLSDEDSDADAITRLLAGAGGTWGSWIGTGDGTGGTCVPSSCCLARWEERTTDFDFEYHEAEWRVQRTGLTPSASYSIRVHLYRRAFGVGAYVLFGYQTFGAMTDGAGNLDVDGPVDNEQGFETYAGFIDLCQEPGGGA